MERERRWTSEVEVVWQRAGPSQVTCQWSVFVLPSRGHDGRPTRHIQSEPAVFIAPSVTDVFSDVSDQTSCSLSLFVHSVVLMSRERSSTNRQHTSYCFTVFICGGPCHLSSFTQSSGCYFPLRTACLFKFLSIKTTQCPFNSIVSRTGFSVFMFNAEVLLHGG